MIPGLPGIPYLDGGLLSGGAMSDAGGLWKFEVVRAFVPDDAPLLWTDDALSVDFLSETWRRTRAGTTTFIRPRQGTGLVQREVRQIREWIREYAPRRC